MTSFDFMNVLQYWPLLLKGLVGTLKLAVFCNCTGFVLGFLFGLFRFAKSGWLRYPAMTYIEVFRNTPVLIQIMWFYFAFPILTGFSINAFSASAIAISMNTVAFVAEITRGGIQSIFHGQWDASKALGMTYYQQLRRVILPQAFKRMIPPFTNRGIEVTKLTTLASTVSFHETLYQAKVISMESFRIVEAYTVVGVMFLLIIFPMIRITYYLEKKFEVRV